MFISAGKLYKSNEEQFMTNVNYRLLEEAPTNLWGELIPTEYGRPGDGGCYAVELENNRKIKCNLKRNFNPGVIGVPARFV